MSDEAGADTGENVAVGASSDDPIFVARLGWALLILGVLAGGGAAMALGWLLSV